MAKKVKPLVELIGEGCLYMGGDGQFLTCLGEDEIVKAQRPGPRSGFDTAHVSRYGGTDFVQWHGRKRDGYFHAWGKIMRLTPAGKKAVKVEFETHTASLKQARAAQAAQTAAAQPEIVE